MWGVVGSGGAGWVAGPCAGARVREGAGVHGNDVGWPLSAMRRERGARLAAERA
jgi:hypothetical protein